MDLYQLNLNLLVALDAVLAHDSVSLAAKQLGLTQSAMSNNLNQLRRVFNDPLMVRDGQRMKPTALAKQLRPSLRNVLQDVENLVQSTQNFYPAISTRTFTVGMNDQFVGELFPRLSVYLETYAPKVRINFVSGIYFGSETPFNAGDYEIALGRTSALEPRVKQQLVLSFYPGCIMSLHHPLAKKKNITLTEFLQYDHIGFVSKNFLPPLFVEDILAKLGVSRRIRYGMYSMRSMLHIIASSDSLLSIAPDNKLSEVDKRSLVVKPLPFEVEKANFYIFWHERQEQDLGHKWLRELLINLMQSK